MSQNYRDFLNFQNFLNVYSSTKLKIMGYEPLKRGENKSV